MLKLIGGICVFAAVAYSGAYMSGRLKTRRNFLHSMSDALTYILSEIEFGRYELETIFKRMDNSLPVYEFFVQCADEISQYGIKKAWKHAVLACRDKAGLKNDDIETLLRLAEQIGMTDISGQKSAISRAVTQIDAYAKKADEEYIRLGKPYRSCGILLGVFLLIILI